MRLRRAVAADRQARAFTGVAVTVVDQETGRAGELVGLLRRDPHRELLPGQVRTGQLEALRGVGLIDVNDPTTERAARRTAILNGPNRRSSPRQ